ncbi:MAG: hypothetical protein P4M07_01175 [Xanthobacteraceae bacterium]|nr:hypothetical protein [Xanthobacteraceae bacterium]
MTSKKPDLKVVAKPDKIAHPGMLGDGTEEQNLNEAGDASKRIKKDELDTAFAKAPPKKR